ncbi:hypothetical protein GIB67_013332 [Kingdonia uniflora]|uniref:Uncharacterized protein n=1 Tax=Kingdonia uniflora TaxID=39325 RepID=A0A7J7LQQ2_9MAGN|nr:hypothetical protein GIB67_013332 [Kingdonia uniflora]
MLQHRSQQGINQAMKRVDSVTQQEDVIQSAILDCKRSFNLSPESDSSLLTRSMSDPFSSEVLLQELFFKILERESCDCVKMLLLTRVCEIFQRFCNEYSLRRTCGIL